MAQGSWCGEEWKVTPGFQPSGWKVVPFIVMQQEPRLENKDEFSLGPIKMD